MKFLKIFIFFENIKMKKENRREEKREGSCSTSYSSGNQVDGLLLVAIYQNIRKKKEQAAPHADTLDHEKHVFECHWFVKVLGNNWNKFKLCIKDMDSDS